MRKGAALLALICLAAGPSRSGGESVLRARLNSDIASTDPGTRRDENTDTVTMHIVEGLVAFRENGQDVAPMLAKSWRVSPDGRTYDFQLRSGVRFHNGAPLTSSEVVWSIRRYLKPETHWRCYSDFAPGGSIQVSSVEATEPLTVRIQLARAAPGFLREIARIDCAAMGIIHPASLNRDGSWRGPIGTGPYVMGGWQRNQYVDLWRFPGYAALPGPRDGNTGGKHALVNHLRFMIIPDDVAAQGALMRGDLDVLDDVLPRSVSYLSKNPGIRIVKTPVADNYVVLLQSKDPILRDVRLRRAIYLSLDLPGMVKMLTNGYTQPNGSLVPSVSRFHSAAHRFTDNRNLVEARRLVKLSGYQGQPIVLVTNHRYPSMFDAAILVQAFAREAGINIQIETVDWATQFSRYLSGNYSAMIHSFSARIDPSQTYGSFIGDGRDKRKVWTDPEAQRLLRDSMDAPDEGHRQAAFDQLNALMYRDRPVIMLYNSTRLTALRASVTGYQGWPTAYQRLWGVRPQ